MAKKQKAKIKNILGIETTLCVRLVDGLLRLGLPREKMVEVIAYEFGMHDPSSDEEFWNLVSEARLSMQQAPEPSYLLPSDRALNTVLAKVMRRQAETRTRVVPISRPPRKKRPTDMGWRVKWKPGDPPDYSSLKYYDASDEELKVAGVESVEGLVKKLNELSALAGRSPVSQGDFPKNRKQFYALVARLAHLESSLGDTKDK